MGQFLDIGLAKNIYVKRRFNLYEFSDIKKELDKNLDLSLYDIEETEEYMLLLMKDEIFEKEIVGLMKEICQDAREDNQKYIKEKIEQIKGKKLDEIMEEADKHDTGFAYLKGNFFTQDISYLTQKGIAFCDIISFITNGKIFMECYSNTFYYLRNCIINSLNSPLRKSMVITISG